MSMNLYHLKFYRDISGSVDREVMGSHRLNAQERKKFLDNYHSEQARMKYEEERRFKENSRKNLFNQIFS